MSNAVCHTLCHPYSISHFLVFHCGHCIRNTAISPTYNPPTTTPYRCPHCRHAHPIQPSPNRRPPISDHNSPRESTIKQLIFTFSILCNTCKIGCYDPQAVCWSCGTANPEDVFVCKNCGMWKDSSWVFGEEWEKVMVFEFRDGERAADDEDIPPWFGDGMAVN